MLPGLFAFGRTWLAGPAFAAAPERGDDRSVPAGLAAQRRVRLDRAAGGGTMILLLRRDAADGAVDRRWLVGLAPV
jgi:hypothetical protein